MRRKTWTIKVCARCEQHVDDCRCEPRRRDEPEPPVLAVKVKAA